MYDSMDYLENRLRAGILQGVFHPREKLLQFVDGLRTIVQDGANLFNVT